MLPIPPEKIVARAGCSPAGCSWSTPRPGRIVDDDEIKGSWPPSSRTATGCTPVCCGCRPAGARARRRPTRIASCRRQQVFGYTEEELRVLLAPMAAHRRRGHRLDGHRHPEAVLSERPRLLFDYFIQLFAQVTNPPLDAIREEVVTSMAAVIGPEAEPARPDAARRAGRSLLPFPVLDNDDLAKLIAHQRRRQPARLRRRHDLRPLRRRTAAARRCARPSSDVGSEADEAIAAGARILVLSDRDSDADRAPIPSLLLTSAVHHHLVRHEGAHQGRAGRRIRRRPRGAPRRAAARLRRRRGQPVSGARVRRGPDRAGLLGDRHPGEGGPEHRLRPRQGRAQGDEQDGHLHRRLVPRRAGVRGLRHRPGRARRVLHRHRHPHRRQSASTSSPPTSAARHALAFPEPDARWSTAGWRSAASTSGAARASCTCSTRRPSTCCSTPRGRSRSHVFRRYTDAVDELSREGATLRGLFELRTGVRPPVPLDEVEPASEIVKRFVTGAMSLRVDLGRGARDAGHRDEQAGRQVQHRRGRRGRRPTARPGGGGRPSSRSRPAGSG